MMQLHVFMLSGAMDADTTSTQFSPHGVPMWTIDEDNSVMNQYLTCSRKQQERNDPAAMATWTHVAFGTYFPFEVKLRQHRLH